MAELKTQEQSRPVSDPTPLTTQALFREIDGLRSECRDRALALRELIETRLDGSDTAIELLQGATERFALHNVVEEKFSSIETQFKERDTRTDQTSRDSKIAIDAALQAAKEAVGKTEVSFTKQIDAIAVNIMQMAGNINDKIDDLKGRLTAIEGKSAGVAMMVGVIFSTVMALGSFSGLIIYIISRPR